MPKHGPVAWAAGTTLGAATWLSNHVQWDAHCSLRPSYQHTQACWSHSSSLYGRNTCRLALCSNTIHCGRTRSQISHTRPCLRDGGRESVSQGAEPWKQGGLGAVPPESQHSTLAWITARSQASPLPLPPAPYLGAEREASTSRDGGGMMGNRMLSQIDNSCVFL